MESKASKKQFSHLFYKIICTGSTDYTGEDINEDYIPDEFMPENLDDLN